MIFLQGVDVLSAVEGAVRSGRRVTAAIAYVGPDAADHLPLADGDVIVVNGSPNAIATGATSVRAIRRWHNAGAAVFSHGRVHAKVIVVGRTAYVGSANLSARARSGHIIEAATVSTDSTLVSEVRAFVRDLANDGEQVDDVWLQWAQAIPVNVSPSPWNVEPTFLPSGPFDLWIGGLDDVSWSDAEANLVQEGLQANAAPRGRFRTECIAEHLDDPDALHDGDLVVLIRPRSARLVRFIERRSSRSAAVGFYRDDITLPTVKLSELREVAASAGTLGPHSEWYLAVGTDRAALLALWDVTDHGQRSSVR
jgi:hypothetical protein